MAHTYKNSGVDVNAGYESVNLIKESVSSTFSKNVLSGIGGFGALFSIKEFKDMEDPVLVSGTDGVGTKLKLAFSLDKHDTIGIDCVAMCVNDIICSGARPLFFLDYIACGKNIPEKIAQIVEGIAKGCKMSECSLIGGETAEMPGFYPKDEYDVAGFAVGIGDRAKLIDGKDIKEGDTIIGVASSGVHSNGFSLIRSIFRENGFSEYVEELGVKIGDLLLTPTKIYVKPILSLIDKYEIKGISNITGGGFFENIPRMIPDGLAVKIKMGSWPVLPVFELIQKQGNVNTEEMFHVFNMGIGMTLAVSPEKAQDVVGFLNQNGENAYIIGSVTKGEGIELC